MGKTLNRILQMAHINVKRDLTVSSPHLKLVFKEGSVALIKKAKGWKNDAEMARALGITRAYISMLKSRRVSVSHNVMLRIAYLMNNFDKWWHFYEVVDCGDIVAANHPIWNMEKYGGTMPYNKSSISADFRRKDYGAETVK
jgi:transcriptional regulator with XRE-family HTH domain